MEPEQRLYRVGSLQYRTKETSSLKMAGVLLTGSAAGGSHINESSRVSGWSKKPASHGLHLAWNASPEGCKLSESYAAEYSFTTSLQRFGEPSREWRKSMACTYL